MSHLSLITSDGDSILIEPWGEPWADMAGEHDSFPVLTSFSV